MSYLLKQKGGLSRGQRGTSTNGGNYALFCIREERKRGAAKKEDEDVFRCGSCDEKQSERLKTREEKKRGSEGVCIIHPC